MRLPMELFALEDLVRRTSHRVCRFVVSKPSVVIEGAIALAAAGAIGGDVRHDTQSFAGTGLLAIGVAGIGHHVQLLGIHCASRLFRHRQERAIVSGLGGNLVRQVVPCQPPNSA